MTAASSDSALVVIPARWASSRFPGKPLADLEGKSVLRRCYEQVCKVVPPARIIIATDDDRIADECRRHGMQFEMTSSQCLTGTDRVAEVAQRHPTSWFVNVQGDEPFLDPLALSAMLEAITTASPSVAVVNAYATLTSEADFRSTTVPKVVVDLNGRLLYISRASIPTTKTLDYLAAARQIGLYAFRDTALTLFSRQTSKTPLEAIEDIEILRFLELGVEVHMIHVPMGGIAIDTPEDLMRAQHFLRR